MKQQERIGKRRPLIGITGNFGDKGCELAEGYYRSVLCAGGNPVVIPPHDSQQSLCSLLDDLDGILFSGGGDINPLLLGEEPIPQLHGICPQRDKAELFLAREAFRRQMPMLGICRGIQTMAAALGGSVWQDIYVQGEGATLKHSQDLPREYASHTVRIAEGTMLHDIFGTDTLAVNSFHHQAVRCPGPHLRTSALSADGIIEAVESTEHKALLGVQWHPECFILRGDETMMPLFRWLTDEADTFAQAKHIHSSSLILDSHCDTPMAFTADSTGNAEMFGRRSERILVDLPKMTEGRLDAVCMVAYLPQGERTAEAFKAAKAQADHLLDEMEHMMAANSDRVGAANTPAEAMQLKAEGRKAIFRGIENGYAIGKDLHLLEHFKQRGIVYMTLCHNGDNDLCDSARGKGEHGGLSDFGRDAVREMNRLGIMVDMSHAAETSFYDTLALSDKPIVCSHSSARALCDHPRNLTDEQMRALAERGGVAQITAYHGFLRTDGNATVVDAVNHLCHAARVMGVEHVGLGTDFDGDGGVPGLADASEIINFTRHLLRRRFSEADIRLIMGGNFLRVMNEVQSPLTS